MPINDTKVMKAVNNMVNSISCEVCKKLKKEILPGLCSKHIFCKECVSKIRHCPSCHSVLKLENTIANFNLASEIAPLLQDIYECLKKEKELIDQEDNVPTTKENQFEVQKESVKTSYTPSSSKISSASGRKTSLCNTPDVNKRNKKGETLLHVACIKGKIEEVRRLLDAGARCATKDYAGWTPLHEVAQQGRVDIAQLLLQHGAKVNAPGGNLNSPLHEAVSAGYTDMVSILMQFGAFPDQHNLYGETARDVAKSDAVSELLKHVPSELSITKSSSDDYECLVQSDQRQVIVMESGLDHKQRAAVTSLVKVLSIQLTTTPSSDVRVVITAAKSNLCERSVAVLTGLSTGAWIVTPEWLEMSAQTKLLVDPEPYEVYGTVNQKIGEAPKRSRLNFKNLMPGLFAGCHIYFTSAINLEEGLDRNVLSQIVRLAGGQVLSRSPDPEDIPKSECTVPFHVQINSPLAKCSHYIIYQKGSREPQMKYNMKHIKSLPHTWLLTCIENFSLIDP